MGTYQVTNRVKRAGWRRAMWRLWRLQWLPRAEFRRLSAFVTTIVKVRGWVLAAPSLVASQTDRTRNKYRDKQAADTPGMSLRLK